MDEIAALAEEAVEHADAWSGLCWFLEKAIQMQAADRGFKELLGGMAQSGDEVDTNRDQLLPSITVLLNRAKHDGSLRQGIEPSDIAALTMILSAVSTTSQPDLWRRYFRPISRRPRRTFQRLRPITVVCARR